MAVSGDDYQDVRPDRSPEGLVPRSYTDSMNEPDLSFLEELQKPDEMALVFNPIGFGGRMEPEDAARFQAEAIADATLVEAVPTEITENFERARKLHLYGVLEYEFFTVASDQVLLVLESAL
jgi:hypothetical protein